MKKLCALLLALTMIFALTACGKSSEQTPGNSQKAGKGGSGIAIDDITVDNWQQVIKDNFDLNVTLPEGWTVTKTVSLGGAHVDFGCKADEAEVNSFLESVFSELKRVASGDITGHYDNAPYNSIEEANAGGLVDAFNLPVNADGSKKIYFSFSKDTGYDEETSEPYIEAVGIYLSQSGKWDETRGGNQDEKAMRAFTGARHAVRPRRLRGKRPRPVRLGRSRHGPAE